MCAAEGGGGVTQFLSPGDRRALVYLLDRLCEYEEGIIDAHTVDGELSRSDALSAVAVMQSRRVFTRAQCLMRELERV